MDSPSSWAPAFQGSAGVREWGPEGGRDSISGKPSIATAANKDTCPFGRWTRKLGSPGKRRWGGLRWEGEI